MISANREGVLTLPKHLTALADGVPGDYIHYDENNSLAAGSTEMIIEYEETPGVMVLTPGVYNSRLYNLRSGSMIQAPLALKPRL